MLLLQESVNIEWTFILEYLYWIGAYWFCSSVNTNAFLASRGTTVLWKNILNHLFKTFILVASEKKIIKQSALGHGIMEFIVSLPTPGLFTAGPCRVRNKSFAASVFRGLITFSSGFRTRSNTRAAFCSSSFFRWCSRTIWISQQPPCTPWFRLLIFHNNTEPVLTLFSFPDTLTTCSCGYKNVHAYFKAIWGWFIQCTCMRLEGTYCTAHSLPGAHIPSQTSWSWPCLLLPQPWIAYLKCLAGKHVQGCWISSGKMGPGCASWVWWNLLPFAFAAPLACCPLAVHWAERGWQFLMAVTAPLVPLCYCCHSDRVQSFFYTKLTCDMSAGRRCKSGSFGEKQGCGIGTVPWNVSCFCLDALKKQNKCPGNLTGPTSGSACDLSLLH